MPPSGGSNMGAIRADWWDALIRYREDRIVADAYKAGVIANTGLLDPERLAGLREWDGMVLLAVEKLDKVLLCPRGPGV
jgi:hypothetical protein